MRRRTLLATAAWPPVAALAQSPASGNHAWTGEISLNGPWQFRLEQQREWTAVQVPHTWQREHPDHLGSALYRREVAIPASWKGQSVRLEFESVYHTAEVYLNGAKAGEHVGKGYTPFVIDLTPHLRYGAANLIEVRAGNSFSPSMLPRGNSYDWTPDGGIYRPVTLHVTPPTYIDRVLIDAIPSADFRTAQIDVRVQLAGPDAATGAAVECEIVEESTGRRIGPSVSPRPRFTLASPLLWHFDHPHLYTAHIRYGAHRRSVSFGIRRFEVKQGGFFLNGERIRPMGVERMAGSHPDYGMAEPLSWIEHDLADMMELNSIFTRVHWMQDRRLLDWCDRHGMMMQLEVPSWGPDTFKGMPERPETAIMENALEQLREMIRADYNHPCIVAWGLCNEINGQGEAQKIFVRNLYREARALDPHRPLTYASHSLFKNPANDISSEMDFASWNQYYGSWQKGGVPELKANLEEVVRVFPGKPLVISEYGYCACTADRPEGDAERIAVLTSQTAHLRTVPAVAGLIFFCYNDYRTHMGDKGAGVLKQRVHGVVDVYGNRKPSFDVLRRESSPIESFVLNGDTVTIRTRATIPSYTLRGYRLRYICSGRGDIPLETGLLPLPDLAPGAETTLRIAPKLRERSKLRVDILRPTGFSVATLQV